MIPFCRKRVRACSAHDSIHTSDGLALAAITRHKPFCWASKVILATVPVLTALTITANDPGSDPETIDTGTIPSRYEAILENKTLMLGGRHRIVYDMDRDMVWRWDQVLKTHPNGMRFSVFGENGELLATNEYFRYGRLLRCAYSTDNVMCVD